MLRRLVLLVATVALALPATAAHGEEAPGWADRAPGIDDVQQRLAETSATREAGVVPGGAGRGAKASRPCWSKRHNDVVGDGGAIDVASYQLAFDCERETFELTMKTATPVPSDWVVSVALMLDTDRDWMTGCGGEYSALGLADMQSSFVDGMVSETPDCDEEIDRGPARFRSSTDRRTLSLSFRHSQVDWVESFEWGAMVMGLGPGGASAIDVLPDAARPHFAQRFAPAFDGYWVAGANGSVRAVGEAKHYGDVSSVPLRSSIVDMATVPNHSGYWLLAADGGIFTFGNAEFYGSAGAWILTQPAVAMAPTPTGRGYWVTTADGGIFTFGDARFFGSMGGRALNEPIVGIASTPTGKGYWLVASDGGIFSFGDAAFHGSAGAMALDGPIVGMAASRNGKGYWLVASDGGIFAFGGAGFYGSTGGMALVSPIVGMSVSPNGGGYRFVAGDGGIFAFGDASFLGSMAAQPLDAPVTSMAG